MGAFEESEAYTVLREETGKPNVVAFRFKITRQVSVELLTTIGDAVHNMRSTLDAVAYELACQHLNGVMTDTHLQGLGPGAPSHRQSSGSSSPWRTIPSQALAQDSAMISQAY